MAVVRRTRDQPSIQDYFEYLFRQENDVGLFDSIAGQVSSALSHGTGSGESSGMMDVIGNLINNPQTGGIQGLINTFQEKGLGGVVSSWISTGQNLPISAEQLQSVLGNEQIQAIAQKLGISTDEVAGKLADLLPQVVDKITPTGSIPEGGALEKGLELLKGLGK